MPSFTAAAPTRPEPARFALGLLLSFGLSLGAAWFWGRALVEATLPLVQLLILWLDDRFAVLALGIDHAQQDTVIRLRVNLVKLVFVGGQATYPDARGWLEVTTTVGAMLQPLVIAIGLAGAWPGRITTCSLRVIAATMLGVAFLLIDLPLTLLAYIWDMFHAHYDPQGFSPLLAWHEFMLAGGRLGMGVLFGMLAVTASTSASPYSLISNGRSCALESGYGRKSP